MAKDSRSAEPNRNGAPTPSAALPSPIDPGTIDPGSIDPDTANRLQLAVTRLARRLRQEIDADLTPSQLSALSSIRRHGPLTLGELASCERVAPPSVTRMVANLEERGFVERVRDDADRRVVRVVATAEADALVAEARRRKSAWVIARLDELPARDRKRLLAAVDALEELADRP